jgi:mannose-6-phosphate isomerase-like protein (cupin superfamily)
MMNMMHGKVWGTTESILQNNRLEVHRLECEAGHHCSEHLHEHKWNAFYVESGHLVIKIWQPDSDIVDVTHLLAGESTSVAPGLWHQFVVEEPTIAFEYYWSNNDSHISDDIQRRTQGA